MTSNATKRPLRAIAALLAAAAVLTPSSADAKRRVDPNGTFRNSDGTISLSYEGEGTVTVKLKTRYCKLEVDHKKVTAGTFVFPHISVNDSNGKALLVIFYTPRQIVVYGELERLKKGYCKGGKDVTGTYKRVRR